MGIYDGLDFKEADEKICSVTTGLVKDNWDSKHPGMIKAEYFLGTTGVNVTGWIPVASPYASKDCGMYMLPEVGSEVVIAFNMGNRNCPIVIGSLWNKKNTLPTETAVEKNTVKRFKSKGGCEIIFNEEKGKEKIEIYTPGKQQITLEDEKQTITIQDKKMKNGVIIQGNDGNVKLFAEKKLMFDVGNTTVLTLDGTGKSVKIATDQITIDASKTIKVKGQNATLEGAQMTIKGTSKLAVQSSGMTQIKGTTVKIN